MYQSEKQKKIKELDNIEVVHQELIKFFNCWLNHRIDDTIEKFNRIKKNVDGVNEESSKDTLLSRVKDTVQTYNSLEIGSNQSS